MAAPAGALQFYRIWEEDGTAMLIDHESLRRVTRAILEAGGSTAAEAELVCAHLVEAPAAGATASSLNPRRDARRASGGGGASTPVD